MTPHIHAEVIKAWADGAEIEYKNNCYGSNWSLCVDSPSWNTDLQYRVKPAPVMAWYRVAMLSNVTITVDSEEEETGAESFDNFIRWLTDRIEYEVTQ